MLAELRGRDDDLGLGHVVVGQEDDLEQIADLRVVVDRLGDGVDQGDDLLRHVVGGGGLSSQDGHPRHHLGPLLRGGGLDRLVAVDQRDGVHQLALVLVDPLDLDVKHGRDGHVVACGGLDVGGELLLPLELDGHPLLPEGGVIGHRLELGEQSGVPDPVLGAERLGDEGSELRVAVGEPPPQGHAVGLVLELLREDLHELREDVLLDDLGVDGSHAVDGERADDGQVGHVDQLLALVPRVRLDDAVGLERFGDRVDGLLLGLLGRVLGRDLGRVSGLGGGGRGGDLLLHVSLDGRQPRVVDLLNELHVARQELLQDGHRPLLEGLRHDRVVGVCEGLLGDLPGLVELEPVDVDQEPHQLRHGDGRVGIVHLEAGLLRELLQVAVGLQEAGQRVLEGGGDEEVLLLETQLLSFGGGVVRVQDGDDLVGLPLVEDGLLVLSGVERLEVELLHRLAVPQPQVGRGRGTVSRDGNVAGDGMHVLLRGPGAVGADRPVKADREAGLRPADLPWVSSSRNPLIGALNLLSIGGDALLEHSVAVADPVSPTGKVERGHRVQEARRQASQSSVSERGVNLGARHGLQVRAESADRVGVLALESQVVNGVGHGASHEELGREVVDELRVLLLPVRVRLVERVHQSVVHGPGRGGVGRLGLVRPGPRRLAVLDVLRDLVLDHLNGPGAVAVLSPQQVGEGERDGEAALAPLLLSARGHAGVGPQARLAHHGDRHCTDERTNSLQGTPSGWVGG